MRYLLSLEYNGSASCARARFYDTETKSIFLWNDSFGHLPYCYTNLKPSAIRDIEAIIDHQGYDHLEVVKKYDLLHDKQVAMTKVVAKDPLSIGGKYGAIRDILPSSWESDIPYHRCYVADIGLIPGMGYEFVDYDVLRPYIETPEEITNQVSDLFKGEERDLLNQYLPLFLTPIPEVLRAALDIEVYSPYPDLIVSPTRAEYPIICVSLAATDGTRVALVLERDDVEAGKKVDNVIFYKDEKELLIDVIKLLDIYPVILTYVGDKFDLPYLYNRMLNLGIRRQDIPIIIKRNGDALLKSNIHVDLFKFFSNRAVQIYAFSAKYKTVDLDTVAGALLGTGKIVLDTNISRLLLYKLAEYCLRDSEITLELTTYGSNLVWQLIFLLMRISKLSIEDLTRSKVSSWIKNLFLFEHRQRGYLIPRAIDIQRLKGTEATTKAVIKGKRYKGAVVIEPVTGIHFNVKCMDYASLYPSIMKMYNLSYETVRCVHEECKYNILPNTQHWVCRKRKGITSLIIGLLKDLRVHWFKPQSKDNKLYYVIQQVMKLLINASYGVFGTEYFSFFCVAVAESITAIARYSILETIKKAKEIGLEVLAGDTDSVFLKSPPEDKIQELTDWCKQELLVDLDIDKEYKYLALSRRKKNYFGVFKDGNVDIKGLTGKKRHTPQFIKDVFYEIVELLKKIEVKSDFITAKHDIKKLITVCRTKLRNGEYSLNDLAFRVQLGQPLESYKVNSQHVKAAKLLKRKVEAGEIITYVKILRDPHVKPIEIANLNEVDISKYEEHLQSTLEQILDALDIDFKEIVGGVRRLDEFI